MAGVRCCLSAHVSSFKLKLTISKTSNSTEFHQNVSGKLLEIRPATLLDTLGKNKRKGRRGMWEGWTLTIFVIDRCQWNSNQHSNSFSCDELLSVPRVGFFTFRYGRWLDNGLFFYNFFVDNLRLCLLHLLEV